MARSQSTESAVAFLNPETAIQGLDANFEGTITRAVWEQWDFKGKAKPKPDGKSGVVMALHVTIDDRDDGATKPHEEYYPAGAIEDFVPSDDGYSFEAVSGKKGFFRDREVIQFSQEVLGTGAIKPSDLGIDPSVFEGKRFYWERKPPTWAKDGSATKSSVLVPTKFVESAGGGGKGKGAGKPVATNAKGKPAPAPDPDDADTAVADLATKLVLEVLEERATDKSLPAAERKVIGRELLGSEVLAKMLTEYKKGPDAIDKDTRAAIGELFENDEFLNDNAGKKTWKYDDSDGEVTRAKRGAVTGGDACLTSIRTSATPCPSRPSDALSTTSGTDLQAASTRPSPVRRSSHRCSTLSRGSVSCS